MEAEIILKKEEAKGKRNFIRNLYRCLTHSLGRVRDMPGMLVYWLAMKRWDQCFWRGWGICVNMWNTRWNFNGVLVTYKLSNFCLFPLFMSHSFLPPCIRPFYRLYSPPPLLSSLFLSLELLGNYFSELAVTEQQRLSGKWLLVLASTTIFADKNNKEY